MLFCLRGLYRLLYRVSRALLLHKSHPNPVDPGKAVRYSTHVGRSNTPSKRNPVYLYVSVGCLEHISADFPTIIVRLNRFPEPSAYEEAGSSIWPIQVTFVGPYAMSTKPVSRKITRTGVWEFGHLTRSGDIEAATSRRILKGEFTNSFLSRREERDRRATSTFKPSNKQ